MEEEKCSENSRKSFISLNVSEISEQIIIEEENEESSDGASKRP